MGWCPLSLGTLGEQKCCALVNMAKDCGERGDEMGQSGAGVDSASRRGF